MATAAAVGCGAWLSIRAAAEDRSRTVRRLADLAGALLRDPGGVARLEVRTGTQDEEAAVAALAAVRDAMLPLLSRDGLILVDRNAVVTAALGQVAAVFGDPSACPVPGSGYPAFIAWLLDRGLLVPGPTESPDRLVAALSHANDADIDVQLPAKRWVRFRVMAVAPEGRAVLLRDVTIGKRREIDLANANVSLDAAVKHAAWRDKELQRANARLDAALAGMSQGLALFDSDDRLLMANSRFASIFNLSPRTLFPGLALSRLASLSIKAGNHQAGRLTGDQVAALLSGSAPLADLDEAAVGERMVSIRRCPMQDGGSVVTYEDVTERSRAQEHVRYLAHHDALTGLANRSLLTQRLEQAVARRASGLAVLCLDLDRFKGVNDTHGHAIGDLLLKDVALRIQACVRGSDTVARLGGDEFAVVLVQAHGQTRDHAADVSRRIVASLAEPFVLDGVRVHTGTSVGVAVAPAGDEACDPARLIEQADFALYQVKATGRGDHCFFEPGMDREHRDRAQIEADLSQAIALGEMELHFQPVVHAASGRITTFEALLRWNHPARGVVLPDAFLPVAERTGKMAQLGEWALRRACEQAAQWPDGTGVAVNVAASQFRDPGLAAAVQDALSSAGLDPARLEIEIGEAVLLAPSALVRDTLARMSAIGVKVSIDDFAARHTCLRHLFGFRFHRLKIDQDFLREFPSDADHSSTVLGGLLEVGRNLRASVTVEGVQSEEDMMFVASSGCDDLQGFYLSPPVRAEDVIGMIGDGGGASAGTAS